MKKKKAFIRFICNRTFWITTGTITASVANELMPIVPSQYVAIAGAGLILLNRLIKAFEETK